MRSLTFPLLLVLITKAPVSAALITWSAPSDVTGASSVLNNGVFLSAIDVGVGSGTLSVNGITFTAQNSAFSASSYTQNNNATIWYSGDTGDADLNSILQSATYVTKDGAGPLTATLTLSGLTSGTAYQVQLLMIDDRTNGEIPSRLVNVDTVTNIDYTRLVATSLVGVFTADGATQSITFSADEAIVLNGVSVQSVVSVPEPTSMMTFSTALLGLVGVALRRRRRLA